MTFYQLLDYPVFVKQRGSLSTTILTVAMMNPKQQMIKVSDSRIMRAM